MNRFIPIYALFIALFALPAAQAQTTGYMGRRFMVKLNLVNGARPLYFGGEVEYAVHRRITLGAGGGYHMGNYKQLYYTQSFANGLYTKSISPSANVNLRSFGFYGQAKFFIFGNVLKSAPDGIYFGLKGGGGYANLESKPGRALRNNMSEETAESFHVKYVPYMQYEFGPGLQKVIAKRFVIDASAYLCYSTFNLNGNAANQEYTATVARMFGPNTVWMGGSGANDKASNGGYKPRLYTGNFGLSLYVKFGILLF